MRNTLYIIVLMASVSLSGCRGTKSVVNGEVGSAVSIGALIDSHKAAFPNFKTLASRVQVMYDDGDKSQSITVNLRMEKDQVIWIKASLLGITLAKALITREQVSYYETISNTYFEGDFGLLSDWLGTELNFEKAQSILLGQSIFSLDDSDYKVSVSGNRYKVQPRRQPQDFIHSLFLNPSSFKVESGSLSQPNEGRLFSINYGAYQQLEGGYYPTDIHIDATDGDEKTKISVTYKNIDINPSVRFPFEIPDGFERIRISK